MDAEWPDEAVCPRCLRRVVQGRVAREEHDDCVAPVFDLVRQQEAIRRLHLATARLVARLGFPDRAAVHEAAEAAK